MSSPSFACQSLVYKYLNACLEDAIEEGDNRGFLLALRDVAEAQGIREVAFEMTV